MSIWNKYKKEQLIYSGNYTFIYKVKNINTGDYFIIKEINKLKFQEFTKTIFEEKKINDKLNIVSNINIIDTIDLKKSFYIIMELCMINLVEYLKIKKIPFSIYEIKEILIQLNNYLQKIENKKLLILEPSHILFSFDKIDKVSIKLTKSIMNNNIFTMPPEILNGEAINEKSNIWNLGVIIYYMLFKEYPYKEKKPNKILDDIELKNKLKSIKDKELSDLLSSMLQIDINKRISWENYFKHLFFNQTSIIPKFNFSCTIHSEEIEYYCTNCNLNICDLCKKEHILHKIIPFSEIGLNEREKNDFEYLFLELEKNINQLTQIKHDLEKFYKDIISIKVNSSIYDNDKKNNYKQYYINYLNILTVNSKIEENLKIINLKNYILCYYDIKKQNLNQPIQILKFIDENIKKEIIEQSKKNKNTDLKIETNDEEIKKNCELYVNNNLINFNSYYNFDKIGKYTIKILIKKPLKNIQFLFHKCNLLNSLDLSNLNSFQVFSMRSSFNECLSLQNIDLSNLVTKNVTNMKSLFKDCSSLKNINISSFNTENVIDMSLMFSGCNSLQYLDLSNFNTIKVKTIKGMFFNCNSLKNINLSYFNTENISEMDFLFQGCVSLTSLNLSNFNTKNVIFMNSMFRECYSLFFLDLSNFNTDKVINMEGMFNKCKSLSTLFINNFNTENVINMGYMFFECFNLLSLDLTKFNTQNVLTMCSMFLGCSTLKDLNLSNFITKKVTNMEAMFLNCSSLISLNISNFDTENVVIMRKMFENCNLLTTLNLSNFNTHNVFTMEFMFKDCKSLQKLDLSNFNTKHVVNMSNMFNGCSSLIDLNISNFNTENVTNMSYMFNHCSSLTKLDLSNFNTIKVTNMSSMFNDCSSLKSINLSKINTENVTDMSSMFCNCSSLKNLDLFSFTTNKVNDMNSMFFGCSSLLKLNLIHFDTIHVKNINSIFDEMNLKECKIECNDVKLKSQLKSNELLNNYYFDDGFI